MRTNARGLSGDLFLALPETLGRAVETELVVLVAAARQHASVRLQQERAVRRRVHAPHAVLPAAHLDLCVCAKHPDVIIMLLLLRITIHVPDVNKRSMPRYKYKLAMTA